MDSKAQVISVLKKNFSQIREKFSVSKIAIFGSYARGVMRKSSDVDILVDFKTTPDIFEFIALEEFLSKLLNRKVDLATRRALKPLIREQILREAIEI